MAAEDYHDMTYYAEEEDDADGPTGPRCQVHGSRAHLVEDSVVYGKSFGGKIWKCGVDGCDYRVGTHPDGSPLGAMANNVMRQARMSAHAAFDAWWKSHGLKRGQAYARLKKMTGVQHIAETTVEQCELIEKTFAPTMMKFVKNNKA